MNQISPLGLNNVGKAKGMDHQHDTHDRKKQRNFVGHILSHGTDGAEQRILVVGSPTAGQDGEHGEGRKGKDQQHAQIHVTKDEVRAERQNQETHQHRHEHQHRGDHKQGAVGAQRSDEFLAHQLDAVRDGLQQSERADFLGTNTQLDMSGDFAFEPNQEEGVKLGKGQHDDEADDQPDKI